MRHRRSTVTRVVAPLFTLVLMTMPEIAPAQNASSITLNAIDPCNKSPSAKVNLNGAAPAGGLVIQLSSSIPASAAVPSTLQVSAGATFADFQITCIPSAQAVAVTITATVGGGTGAVTAVVNVLAPVLSSITVQPHTGGASVNGQVALVSPAPTGGVVVTLSSSSTKATVPPFVTVPAGSSNAAITVTTRAVAQNTPVSIIATGLGVTKTVEVTLVPPRPTAIGFNTKPAPTVLAPTRTVEGSNGAGLRLNIGMPAPPGGLAVPLTSSNPAAVTVPASVTVASGETFADFGVTTSPVAQTTAVTITATSGGVSQTCVLTVTAPELRSFSLTPTTVIGGQPTQGRLFYFAPAPAGGTRITLSSNNPGLVAVPPSVTVPAGEQDFTFPIPTNGLEQRAVVTVSAAEPNGQKKSVQLELVPEGPSALSVAPAPVTGGINTKGEVDAILTPDQFVVQLSSSNAKVASVPGSVSFSGGTTRKNFVITTTPVAENTRVTISATTTSQAKAPTLFSTAGPQKTTFTVTRTFALDVLAPVVTGLTLDNSSVVGGTNATGRVTISGPAPVGGFPVRVGMEEDGLFYGSNITVPAGATSAPFSVTTHAVTSTVNVIVTATTGNVRKIVGLTMRPS